MSKKRENFSLPRRGKNTKTRSPPQARLRVETIRRQTQRETTIKSAPLHDFGSNGSKDKTSCGVHPTDKRIVGLSCPNLYCAGDVEEAADFVATMPPVATKPPTSITFLALNNDALFCFFFSMITSSLRRDRVSLSFLTNVFILLPSLLLSCVYQTTQSAKESDEKRKRSDEQKREREEKKEIQTLNIFKETQTLNILNTKKIVVSL